MVESIKCVKEGLLGLVFATDKLDIINDEDVKIAIFIGKLLRRLIGNVVDIVISEFLCGDVEYSLVAKVLQDGIADSLNQVSLT